VVVKISIFWDLIWYSPLEVNRGFGGTCHFRLQGRRKSQARNQREAATCFTLVYRLAHSSTLKVEMICSPKTLVDFQRTTRCYIPEDRTLQITLPSQLEIWPCEVTLSGVENSLRKNKISENLTIYCMYLTVP
jgi:hypothetical protein